MDEKISKLRQAALSDSLDLCIKLSEEMICELNFADSLLYGIASAKSYLPNFEEMYPEIRWPREFLALLEKLEPIEYASHSFNFDGILARDSSDTGSRAFLDGLEFLKNAFDHHLKNWDQIALDLVGGAVSELIAARVHTHWSRQHPSEYIEYLAGCREYAQYLDRRMEGHTENPAELERIENKIQLFWGDTERKQFHQHLYLELADDLERLLGKSEMGRNE